MKRICLFLIMWAIASTIGSAQTITRTFIWDASASAPGPADNPVKYRFYTCTDAGLLQCTNADTDLALTKDVTLSTGIVYLFVRAYWFAMTVDGVPSGDILESGNSNVLKVEVHVPPGNPNNARIKVTTVGASISGQTMRRRG